MASRKRENACAAAAWAGQKLPGRLQHPSRALDLLETEGDAVGKLGSGTYAHLPSKTTWTFSSQTMTRRFATCSYGA